MPGSSESFEVPSFSPVFRPVPTNIRNSLGMGLARTAAEQRKTGMDSPVQIQTFLSRVKSHTN